TDDKADWLAFLSAYIERENVTDLVLYGDTRDIHSEARAEAQRRGLTVHCFEEGYLRPYWVTYEHGGVNGHSPLMDMSVAEMRAQMEHTRRPEQEAPAQWGALWHHIFLGALYHWHVLSQRSLQKLPPAPHDQRAARTPSLHPAAGALSVACDGTQTRDAAPA
ncbi:MAG: hypothetical protein AAFY59_07610, partial [Pseudomonadota bacterium]